MRLSEFSVLTFDCYGTLIDWETGIRQAMQPALRRAGRAIGEDEVLAAFGRAEAAQQAETPSMLYPELLARVYRRMCAELAVAPDDGEAEAFGASVEHWPAFADCAAALVYLKQHYRLVILSNVDRASFAHSNAKLGVDFDAVYTAQDIGSYKPDPRNFAYMLKKLAERGIDRHEILHTAESLRHDHVQAKAFGLASCWIHRRAEKGGFGAAKPPDVDVEPDFRFPSLAAMVETHRAERQ